MVKYLLIFLLTTPLFADKAREGEKLYQEKKYGEAAEKFLEAEVEDPENFQHSYNKGVSQYKAGDYGKAAEAFQKSTRSEDPDLKKKSLYNLGNALYKKGDLEGSVKAFEQAIKADPENQKIKENKKWVEEQIKKQKQQQKQNNKIDL